MFIIMIFISLRYYFYKMIHVAAAPEVPAAKIDGKK